METCEECCATHGEAMLDGERVVVCLQPLEASYDARGRNLCQVCARFFHVETLQEG